MKDVSLTELRDDWTRIAGPLVAATTRPFMLTQSGTLVVECASPIWLDKLEARTPELLRVLPLVDGRDVRAIRFAYVPPANAIPQAALPFDAARPRRGAKKKGR